MYNMGSSVYFYIVHNMISQPAQEIRELRKDELTTAAELLARAMCDNPIFVQVFGTDRDRRQKALTHCFLAFAPRLQRRGYVLGAFRDSLLTAVCGVAMPGRCKESLFQRLTILPHLVRGCSPTMLIRAKRWMDEWFRLDLQEPHFHLGPGATDTHLQGHGIFSAMLWDICTRMDKLGATAYLETDKLVNVRFYERFGFVTVQEGQVLGIPNWFMRRPAGKTSA